MPVVLAAKPLADGLILMSDLDRMLLPVKAESGQRKLKLQWLRIRNRANLGKLEITVNPDVNSWF